MTLEFKKYPENIPPPYDGIEGASTSNQLLLRGHYGKGDLWHMGYYFYEKGIFFGNYSGDFNVTEWAIIPKI